MELNKENLKPYIELANNKYNDNIYFRNRVDYAQARKKYTVDERTIMYTAFYGRGLCCNPYAIFCYLKNDDRFKKYTHVWVLDSLDEHKNEIKEYRREKNVIFVEFESKEYFKYLSKAKYLINNSTEQVYFIKKEEQVLINTWHGIPLKTMGFDIPGGGATIGNTLRNFVMDDYLLSPNAFMTKMYSDAYKLNNVYEGTIIEAGYPRCDTLFKTSKAEFAKKIKNYGINLDINKKIVLYAPTWKGAQFGNPNTDIGKDLDFIESLYNYLDRSKYQILFKPHQAVFRRMQTMGMDVGNCVPAAIDANEILAVSDVLISDYSSIFFDFLVTGRPILFYIPDLETYQQERGLYFPVDSLPGPITTQADDIGKWLKLIDKDKDNYKELFDYQNYEKAVQKFVYNEDGKACERIVENIFFGKHNNEIKLASDKTKILVHVDVLKLNGITSAALNMLKDIDYDKYDVTLLANVPKSDMEVWNTINKNVRAFCRVGTIVTTMDEFAVKEFYNDNAVIITDGAEGFPEKIFELEFRRTFGDMKFDYIINYSGYSGYWSNIYYTVKGAKNIIWMHNDLKSELDNRIVNGVQVFKNTLPQVFKHYKNMYKIVGCSESTMIINREKLGTEDTYNKFSWMHNMLDYTKIYDNMDSGDVEEIDGKKYHVDRIIDDDVNYQFKTLVPIPEKNNINFINIGRLSPEKNQENLIRAFAQLSIEEPDARLYILGDGPLRDMLHKLITDLNLTGKVFLLGNVKNPFYIEKRCQCFVLPSYHEGMPMVLLEARTLGLSIVVSDFSTVADSLHDGGQLLIQTDEESILEGMRAFLAGKVPNDYKFDPVQYNKECMAEFERLLK